MDNTQIHLLHAFWVFTQSKSVYKAAERLGISQPMLSVYLKEFEQTMPQSVFQMMGRKKALTAYGEKLADSLSARFSGLPELIRQLAIEYQSEEQAKIKIAGYRSLLRRVALKTKFKGSIEFLSDNHEHALDWLQNGKADLAIVREVPDSLELVVKKAFSDEHVLVFPKKWNLPSENLSKANLEVLWSKPFLSYEKQSTFLQQLSTSLNLKESIEPTRIFSDWPVIFELLSLGKGWAIAPDSYLAGQDTLTSLRLPKELRNGTDFFVVSRRSDQKIPWLKTMVQELQEIFQENTR